MRFDEDEGMDVETIFIVSISSDVSSGDGVRTTFHPPIASSDEVANPFLAQIAFLLDQKLAPFKLSIITLEYEMVELKPSAGI